MTVRLIHNIGLKVNANYNTLMEVAKCRDRLTFDGIYLNIWENQQVLLPPNAGRPILFVMGDYVGKDNSFDHPMPREKYCNWNQIMDLVIKYNCELGWHTWSHPNLTLCNDEQLLKEVTPPFPMKHFGYPYGNFDARVIQAVQKSGFEEAWSVNVGDNSQFQRLRSYL